MKKDSRKKKPRIASNEFLISDTLQNELLRFIEYHPAYRFNRNLRKMLLDYLMHESSLEDLYIKDLLYDLQGLFELLDAIEMEGRFENEFGRPSGKEMVG